MDFDINYKAVRYGEILCVHRCKKGKDKGESTKGLATSNIWPRVVNMLDRYVSITTGQGFLELRIPLLA